MGCEFASQNNVLAGHGPSPKIDQKPMATLFGKCDWQHCDSIDLSGAKLQFSDVGRPENHMKSGVGNQCIMGCCFWIDFGSDLGSIFDGFRDDFLDVECRAGNWG